ncbi:MAG: hypothetical protein PHG58_03235 [Clostridia bacterium]|nr:hypothetical protein [Clostridia bacterium]
MKIRNLGINIRVSPDEKKKISKNSKRCGLSLSEYLRQLANGYEPRPNQPYEFEAFTFILERIYTEMKARFTAETEQKLLDALQVIQERFILPQRRENCGNDKNMADQGQSETGG